MLTGFFIAPSKAKKGFIFVAQKAVLKMKVSEVNINVLKNYIRIDIDEDDELLNQILNSVKEYIQHYTGLTIKEIDQKEDMTIALFALCAEMYDNRQYTISNGRYSVGENKIVSSILNMHSVNLL